MKWCGRYLRRKADRLLDEDNPIAAWRAYQRIPRSLLTTEDYWMRGVCCLIGLGDYDRALMQFADANNMRGSPRGKWRVLRGNWIGAIGHVGQIDYVVRMNLLEGGTREDLILYLPRPQNAPNTFYLSQYLPYMTVVNEPGQLPFSSRDMSSMEFDLLAPRTRDGDTKYFWGVAADVYQRWELQQAPPLIRYPQQFAREARRRLAQLGMPQDAWFVTVHVREAASHQSHRKLHELRNAHVADYLPTLEEIVARGGWVVRLGDGSMTSLPVMKNVIDYPFQAATSDWLDIFLLSQNKFHIGSPSGLSYVPGCYGKPTLFANYWPPLNRPWHASDLFIPKMYHHPDGTPFALGEAVRDPYRAVFSLSGLREAVSVKDNDPEDIRLAAIEMLQRIDGGAVYDERDGSMQTAASIIQETNRCYGSARIARDFLRRNPQFVDMSNIDQVATADRAMRAVS